VLLLASSPALAATIKPTKAAYSDALIGIVSAHDNLCVQRIAAAIQSLLQGVGYEDPHLLIADPSSQTAAHSLQRLFSDLSPRLIEVVVLHTLGWSNSEIAASMGVTEATVLKYWKRVYERLHMTRTEVRRFASSQMLAHPLLFVSWQHMERPSYPKNS
jgi:DNA-binding NarL/FixJ family response regulator